MTSALPLACLGQLTAESPPRPYADFVGFWSGTWSQGAYGTQRIHVTHVTDQCVATLAYSPTQAPPQVAYQLPVKQIEKNLKATFIIQHDPRDIGKLPAFPAAAR